jgi:beta-alanine degradation protein BauB
MKRYLLTGTVLVALPLAILGVLHSQPGALQTQRFPEFQNDDVKVWKSVVLPNSPLAMHRHDHPRIIIALTGGTMNRP